MNCAWTYLVVSSSPQADTIDDQRAWAQALAREKGWSITREFSGVASGKAGIRTILDTLLRELECTPKAARPERVLMIRLDRVGRMALDAISALARIKALGVTLHTRTDGDVALDSAVDTLRPILELVTAEIENAGRRDKTRNAHARFRAEGKHFGPPPYGTAKDDQKRLIPQEPQAGYVLQAFELRATGAGYLRIAAQIGRHAPAQGVYGGKPRAATWHRHTVMAMLKCRSYRGLVVPEALWDRVQTIKNADFKTRITQRFPWPLQGAVKCWCGWTLAGVVGGSPSKRIRYYHCPHPMAHHHAGEKRPMIRAERLEEAFVGVLARIHAQPGQVVNINRLRPAVDLGALETVLRVHLGDLRRIERQKDAAFDLQADGHIDAGELGRRLERLKNEEAEARECVHRTQTEIDLGSQPMPTLDERCALIERAATLWPAAAIEDRKELARLIALRLGGLQLTPDLGLAVGMESHVFPVKHSRMILGNRIGAPWLGDLSRALTLACGE